MGLEILPVLWLAFGPEKGSKVIQLNDQQQKDVLRIAEKRIAKCRELGAIASYYGARDPLSQEVGYYGGEVAFCWLFGVEPDRSIDKFLSADCIVNGARIDVKWTHYKNGLLLAKNKNWNDPPDYFALMVGAFPEYRYAGYMAARLLLDQARIDKYKRIQEPAYQARQWELKGGESR